MNNIFPPFFPPKLLHTDMIVKDFLAGKGCHVPGFWFRVRMNFLSFKWKLPFSYFFLIVVLASQCQSLVGQTLLIARYSLGLDQAARLRCCLK